MGPPQTGNVIVHIRPGRPVFRNANGSGKSANSHRPDPMKHPDVAGAIEKPSPADQS
jgi:hypothetical protein